MQKPKNNGIDGNLFSLNESFSHKRNQRVVFNFQSSKWKNVYTGVPQGLVFGPLFPSFILTTFRNVYILMSNCLLVKLRGFQKYMMPMSMPHLQH